MKEIFVDITTDKDYQISNFGNVKRKGHFSKSRFWKEKLMTIGIDTEGYPRVALKGKPYRIHRLIAEHFIPNPENKAEVNHINGIRTDFRIVNLEWVTRTENQIHSWEFLGRKATWGGKSGFAHHSGKPINQYDIDGNFITQYGSATDAAKSNGWHHYIVDWAIKKKSGYYKGNIFTYAL